jgi:hypothetical protein
MPYNGINKRPCYSQGFFFPTAWCSQRTGIALTSPYNRAAPEKAGFLNRLRKNTPLRRVDRT